MLCCRADLESAIRHWCHCSKGSSSRKARQRSGDHSCQDCGKEHWPTSSQEGRCMKTSCIQCGWWHALPTYFRLSYTMHMTYCVPYSFVSLHIACAQPLLQILSDDVCAALQPFLCTLDTQFWGQHPDNGLSQLVSILIRWQLPTRELVMIICNRGVNQTCTSSNDNLENCWSNIPGQRHTT